MDSLSFRDPREEADLEDLARFVKQRGRHRPEPQRLADCISRLLARRGYAQAETARQLVERWASAVGPTLAGHSRAAGLQRGVLEVVVRTSTALQELTFQKNQLLGRLNVDAKSPAIRELRFRIGPLD